MKYSNMHAICKFTIIQSLEIGIERVALRLTICMYLHSQHKSSDFPRHSDGYSFTGLNYTTYYKVGNNYNHWAANILLF